MLCESYIQLSDAKLMDHVASTTLSVTPMALATFASSVCLSQSACERV